MNRKQKSRAWLHDHINDPYVKQAQKDGYRSRAAYKLLEIQEKDKFIQPHMTIVELGAAPGSWTQILSKMVDPKKGGRVIALDLLPMDPVPHVEIIQGDFHEDETVNRLITSLEGRSLDLVVSDMAPNMSGIEVVDQAKIMYLAELALDFTLRYGHIGSHLLMKVFHGEGFDDVMKLIKIHFTQFYMRKPEASRSRSSESYLLAKNMRKKLED
mgnify:CR=1 FL=1